MLYNRRYMNKSESDKENLVKSLTTWLASKVVALHAIISTNCCEFSYFYSYFTANNEEKY